MDTIYFIVGGSLFGVVSGVAWGSATRPAPPWMQSALRTALKKYAKKNTALKQIKERKYDDRQLSRAISTGSRAIKARYRELHRQQIQAQKNGKRLNSGGIRTTADIVSVLEYHVERYVLPEATSKMFGANACLATPEAPELRQYFTDVIHGLTAQLPELPLPALVALPARSIDGLSADLRQRSRDFNTMVRTQHGLKAESTAAFRMTEDLLDNIHPHVQLLSGLPFSAHQLDALVNEQLTVIVENRSWVTTLRSGPLPEALCVLESTMIASLDIINRELDTILSELRTHALDRLQVQHRYLSDTYRASELDL